LRPDSTHETILPDFRVIGTYAQSGYRPGMLGVDTNLRPNPDYMKPSTPPPVTRPAPVSPVPSRGIPPQFKPQPLPMQPRSPFERALEHPIASPPPPAPPPARVETHGNSQTTVSAPIPVARDVTVTPSVTVTPPQPTINAPTPSLDAVGITVRKGPEIKSE